MGRPFDPAYAERNQDMVSRYQSDNSITLHMLADETGLSKLRVRRILEEAGVEIRSEPRRARVDINYRNNHLVAMGARLHAERMKRGISTVEMAVGLGVSEAHLGAALQGLYDWRFKEMVRAARFLNISLEEFVRLPQGLK